MIRELIQRTRLLVIIAIILALALGVLVGWRVTVATQRIPLRAADVELDPIENHPVELDPCGAEGMVVSPSEDGSAMPGYVMVLVFKADGPFLLARSAREKLLGISTVRADEAGDVFGWVREGAQ